jgi:hypothetical protein
MAVRAVFVTVAALLIAVQVIRNAAVNALAQTNPDTAAKFWKGHPTTEMALAMTEIARSSRARRAAPEWAFSMIDDAASKAPLAAEPYLVRGVQAGLARDNIQAMHAFEAAQWRDPRSLPAAYFLADRYFRAGDVGRGLRQAATLARLAPDGGGAAIPYLVQYAQSPGNWPALRELFRADPQLYQPVLSSLASNVKTVPAAVALSNPGETGRPQWLVNAVYTLVGAGDYPRARAAWARLAGTAPPGEFLHDASFSDKTSPPPFNWQLTSSTVGLAERETGGRLHVLFYGDEDGTLASQLLLLSPGSYRLSLRLAGDPARAHALTWAIWCDKAAQPIASVTLDVVASRGWQFQVPTGCPAQWLKLSGVAADVPQQVDVSISGLTLSRGSSGA